MLDKFSEVSIENPCDKIIRQIRGLISTGELKPGDKLPPERKLSEKMKVGRSTIRDAIKKLEFYGIVKTLPQSGTVVSGLGITALEGLITEVLNIEENDFASLVETRKLLELGAVTSAAQKRTGDDIIALQKALVAYEEKILSGQPAIEEDLLFHIKIAEASKNNVLKILMLIITPDIVKSFNQLNVCGKDRPFKALEEHKQILEHIINQESDKAKDALLEHLQDILAFSKSNPKLKN